MLSSCKKEGPPAIKDYYKTGIIEGEYLNENGDNPTIKRSSLFVSPAIKLLNADIIGTIENGRAYLKFRNVRFNDDLGTYAIGDLEKDIIVEEVIDGKWQSSDEAFVNSSKDQRLGVVLVIDNSTSLAEKISDVRNAALRFVDVLRASFPPGKVEVGLVVFSGVVDEYEPTDNLYQVQENISKIGQGQAATNLYTAVNTGLDMVHKLDESDFRPDGVALISFTDGVNDGGLISLDELLANLKQPTLNGGTVPSYVIAYEGGNGVDSKLPQIASNGGIFQKTTDSESLIGIFVNIANKVSALYAVTYDRSPLVVRNPKKFRIRFKLKLS
jgi:uncharacterized protein YegL